MMFLISKIIAKEWFKSLLGAITVLFLLISIGDIINGFLRGYEAKRIFIEYALKMPEMMGKMIPISALLASLFSVNKLKSHSELMAILAGGYSATKIYKLIFICSLFVGAIQFLNLGFTVPLANKIKRQEFEKSRKNESRYLARSTIGESGLIWYKTDNYFTSFEAFDPDNNELKNISIYFIAENSALDSIYKARKAKFLNEGRWRLDDVSIVQKLEGDGFPAPSQNRQLIVSLDEKPEDFVQFESDITTLNIFNLSKFINRLENTDINSTEYKVMFLEKLSLSFICLIFSLFPLSGVFNPNRRSAGFGKSIVFTILFSIFFWGIQSGAIALGNSAKIPAIIATLGVPFLFGIYIFYTFYKNRKL